MDIILDFITTNYVWILSGLIVVLLIIIGYYADKTNFGQNINKPQNIDSANEPDLQEEVLTSEVNEESTEEKAEETTFDEYEEEIDKLLPEKDIISGDADDLLSDVNNLSLDKTQRINLSDIPDLDDVDMPRIKKLQKEDEDIWDI